MRFSRFISVASQMLVVVAALSMLACKKQPVDPAPPASEAQAVIIVGDEGKTLLAEMDMKTTILGDFSSNEEAMNSLGGGWGYSPEDAVTLANPHTLKNKKSKKTFDFVPVEYLFVRLRNFEEFVIQPDNKFMVLSEEALLQELVEEPNARQYDKLTFSLGLVPADMAEKAYQAIQATPENEETILKELFEKRVFVERIYWFDITDVYGQYVEAINKAEAKQKNNPDQTPDKKAANKTGKKARSPKAAQ